MSIALKNLAKAALFAPAAFGAATPAKSPCAPGESVAIKVDGKAIGGVCESIFVKSAADFVSQQATTYAQAACPGTKIELANEPFVWTQNVTANGQSVYLAEVNDSAASCATSGLTTALAVKPNPCAEGESVSIAQNGVPVLGICTSKFDGTLGKLASDKFTERAAEFCPELQLNITNKPFTYRANATLAGQSFYFGAGNLTQAFNCAAKAAGYDVTVSPASDGAPAKSGAASLFASTWKPVAAAAVGVLFTL